MVLSRMMMGNLNAVGSKVRQRKVGAPQALGNLHGAPAFSSINATQGIRMTWSLPEEI